jgi:hypothetical protein
MITNLLLGLPTMILCLFMQSLLLLTANQYYRNKGDLINSPSVWSSMLVINSVMLILVAGNLAQIGIWALLFTFLEEFEVFAEAFYHSSVNFATLGYGDFVMSDEHKLLGPLQAVNGVLMIGVSTSILMTGLQDAMRRTRQARES